MGADAEQALVLRMFYDEVKKRRERQEDRAAKYLAPAEVLQRSPAEIDETLDRVYEAAVRRRHDLREQMDQEIEEQLLRSKVPPLHAGGVAAASHRLCDREVESRRERRELLVLKHTSPGPQAAAALSPSRLQACNTRLYSESVEKHLGTLARLRGLYSPKPSSRKLTSGQQTALASRLSPAS
ncbi:hypothetical protein DIPPA_15198 [Diplonema papillatum]|nr:hypothetical protein DIPPA_15198 [Diplonema papillatum]